MVSFYMVRVLYTCVNVTGGMHFYSFSFTYYNDQQYPKANQHFKWGKSLSTIPKKMELYSDFEGSPQINLNKNLFNTSHLIWFFDVGEGQ